MSFLCNTLHNDDIRPAPGSTSCRRLLSDARRVRRDQRHGRERPDRQVAPPPLGSRRRVSPAISTDNSRNLTPAAPPAIECNVYHCTQSTRRRLTFICSVGVRQPTYHELTIWGKTEGTAFSHAFAGGLGHAGTLGQSRPPVRRLAARPGWRQVPPGGRPRSRDSPRQRFLAEPLGECLARPEPDVSVGRRGDRRESAASPLLDSRRLQ